MPGMALRTYRFLRFGVIGVIVALAASIIQESVHSGCLQGSISAYYYTPARSIFVGALVVIGFVMIALWGKSSYEDGFLNLAGLLAPVVAFVPTTETDDIHKCSLVTSSGGKVGSDAVEQKIVDTASQGAVDNNMLAYLVVVGLVLAVIAIRGWVVRSNDPLIVMSPRAFWMPLGAASTLWLAGTLIYLFKRTTWMYHHTHKPAAILLFVCIIAAVIAIGFYKRDGNSELGDEPSETWAHFYWWLAAVMSVGAGLVLLLCLVLLSHWEWWPKHWVFMLEAWMIGGLAVFWIAQTIDRWNDGAPPKTEDEKNALKAQIEALNPA